MASFLFITRSFLVTLLTLLTGLAFLLAIPITLPSVGARIAWRRMLMYAWGRSCMAVCGARQEIVGEVPAAPFFLVSNHVSTMDIFTLAAATGGRFVGKAELGSWPLVGKVISGMGTILIDRSRRTAVGEVNRILSLAMSRGENILLFVEGGIRPGDQLYPFQPSLLQPAVDLGRPVHCALIHYETPAGSRPASQTITWPKGKGTLQQFRDLFGLRRYRVRLTFGAQPLMAGDRKQLAADLRAAMQPLFEPVK
ncbi:MAG TPA: lysophospholipid acyltransferase family protein [Planctomycetota bacterium]|nr:lysophospholipid acyltransferase family protein [Planctomycetota bacterium]